ncbi:hypothetical protein IKE98_00115 [Candidatus Saccharibacteria bacterium]|nr:hypothetical protein [Candidatus Saccharibacteria bacterium]
MNGNDKSRKTRNLAWAICMASFLTTIISSIIMQTSWYPDQTLQGWPMIISTLVCLCSFIVAVNQTIKYSKLSNTLSTKSQAKALPKNSPANAVVSLVCAIIPLVLYFATSILSIIASQSGWHLAYLAFYYMTIGVPLFLVWLICGIFGLKSKKRKIAIISLIIKPVGLLILTPLIVVFSR